MDKKKTATQKDWVWPISREEAKDMLKYHWEMFLDMIVDVIYDQFNEKSVIKDYLTTENNINLTLPTKKEYRVGDVVRYYNYDWDHISEEWTPMYATNPLVWEIIKSMTTSSNKKRYYINRASKVGKDMYKERIRHERVVCMNKDRVESDLSSWNTDD